MGDLWRALGYLLTYWRFTLGAFVSLLLVTFTNLVNPQILRRVIDHGNQRQESGGDPLRLVSAAGCGWPARPVHLHTELLE